MIEEVSSVVRYMLGLDARELAAWQMALRALIVYIAALAMVRLSDKRFIGKNTAFDVILGIVFGSVVSRAITGNAPFFETLGVGLVLVSLHWLFAACAFHSDFFGTLIKGHERTLIEDGKIRWDHMRKSHISENDLLSALRRNAHIADPGDVQNARFERSGEISVIPRGGEPRVLEVQVAEGVQTIRIKLE